MASGYKKTRIRTPPESENILIIHMAVSSFDTIPVQQRTDRLTHGRTDRPTDRDLISISRISLLKRDKTWKRRRDGGEKSTEL